jgi:hypothetical protein
VGPTTLKKRDAAAMTGNTSPKGDPSEVAKGDRADVRRFNSAVAKRLRTARGWGAETLSASFHINESGRALTCLVNRPLRLFATGPTRSNLHSTMRTGQGLKSGRDIHGTHVPVEEPSTWGNRRSELP